jgi:hypothetical protein
MTSPCPRCRAETTKTVATSPVPGCWTIQTCDTCHYGWRSTEPATATDPDDFPAAFAIDPQTISSLPAVPPIGTGG